MSAKLQCSGPGERHGCVLRVTHKLEQLHLSLGLSFLQSKPRGEKNLQEVCLHLRSRDLQDNRHQNPHHLSPFTGWGPQLQENWEERMLETALLTGTWLITLWKIKSKWEERSGTQLLQAAPGGGVGFPPTRTPFWCTRVHNLDQKGTLKK